MGRYLIKRILVSMLTLFVLATLCFLLLKVFPGGPFDEEVHMAPQVLASLKEQYGLDQPLFAQLGLFLKNLTQFDLGKSILYSGQPVVSVIGKVFPRTLNLGLSSLFISILFGFLFGSIGAGLRKPHLISILHLFFLSAPSLFLGPLLILIFSLWLGIFPVTVNGTFSSYILPVVVLSLKPMIGVARLIQNSIAETSLLPWVITVRSYGISEERIFFKHILRNSLLPALTYIGTMGASLLSGSILIEMIFNVNGVGSLFVEAIMNRDYQLTIGLTLLYGVLLTFLTLSADFIIMILDPRIRVDEK